MDHSAEIKELENKRAQIFFEALAQQHKYVNLYSFNPRHFRFLFIFLMIFAYFIVQLCFTFKRQGFTVGGESQAGDIDSSYQAKES